MFDRVISRSLPFALLASALVACGDSTGPKYNPFDPDRAQADADAMVSAFDSPALQQFMGTTGYINLNSSAMNAAIHAARQSLATGGRVSVAQHRQIAAGLRDVLVGNPEIAAAAVIPQEVRGKTFVYDANEHMYVPSDRTGAPSNGVRYILYELDGGWGEPNPSSETGYIDITDQSPAGVNTFGVRLRVVSGGTTYLDYTVTGSAGQNSASVDIGGFVTNGTVRVDYNTSLGLQQNAANIQWQFRINSRSFSVQGAITNYGSEDMGAVEIIVNSNRAQVRYLFPSGSVLTGQVYVNGALYANIAEGEYDWTFTGTNGQPLPQAEVEAFESLLYMGIESFFWAIMLIGPVGGALPL